MIVHIEGSMEEVQEMLSKFAIENKKPAQAVRPAPESLKNAIKPQMKTPDKAPDKPGNSNVLSPKDLKLPRFDYDKGLRKQHGLIFLTEMPDGRVVIEYGKAHYYTTKEKVLQIKYPFPEKYFSKENGWSSTAEMAFKKYREYLAQPQPAELKAKDPDPEDEKYKPMLKGAFNTRPGREDYDKIEGALEA